MIIIVGMACSGYQDDWTAVSSHLLQSRLPQLLCSADQLKLKLVGDAFVASPEVGGGHLTPLGAEIENIWWRWVV